MLRLLTRKALAALLLAAPVASVTAQVFSLPTAHEFTYGSNVRTPQSTSCHAMPGNAAYFPSLGLGSVDLYVAGWNDPGPTQSSEVTILLTGINDPTNILWQGSIFYTDVQDLEVGSLRNPTVNETSILVAYYRPGSGHFLDIYMLDPGGTATLIDQKILSGSPAYGRIRMDFHSLYTGVVAWINTEPGANNGIQTMVYQNQTWSGVTTLDGTATATDMDIALEEVIGQGRELHLVSTDAGQSITESSVAVSLLTTSPVTATPSVNDYVYLGTGTGYLSRLVLDCAGFSNNGSRWAYTYSDASNVMVRLRDPAVAGGVPQTAVLTDGSLGNTAIVGQCKVFSPTLNYEMTTNGFGTPFDIMVAWYASDFNRYMALRMDPSGTFVTSAGDYLSLPNAQTSNMIPFLPSGIALNKTDEKVPSRYSYATYYDVDPASGLYQLHHAFHTWTDVFFRGEAPAGEAPGRGLVTDTRISTYPGPFSDLLNIAVTMQHSGDLELVLTDITGRVAAQTKTTLPQGNHQVKMDDLGRLAPGTYVLTVLLDHKKAGIRKVTKQ